MDQLAPKVDEFEKGLSAGYSVAIGGSVEESAKSQAPIAAVVPLMLFIMATILMIQLQSFHRLFLVFAVAPLWVCRSPPDERVQQYRQVVEGHARGRHHTSQTAETTYQP